MDNQPITVEQASNILRQQWNEGRANFYSVAHRLSPQTVESLLMLVEVDVRAAASARVNMDVSVYIRDFPQLEPYRSEIEALASKYSRPSLNTNAPSQAAVDMYSKNSIAETHDFDLTSAISSPQSNIRQSIVKRDVPFTLGNFLVEKFIGEGSFGTVWAGKDIRLGRMVAIKIQHGSERKGLLDGFVHEARSIVRLDNPNIVRLLQADESEDGIGYLVYEYVEGDTLDERIKTGNHTISEYVHWVAAIADALDYAHRNAIIHRDISPRNIMITKTGIARLLDFGLSSIDGDFILDDKNRILGTPAFMSPEQASGNPHWATSYSDQFSLGSVLYYALTKRLPFPGKSTFDVLERIQKAAPASLRSTRADIPIKLEKACLRAMAKEPQKRYSTAADMAAALINSLEEPASSVPGQTTVTKTTYPMLALGALLVLVGLGVSVVGIRELFIGSASSRTASMPTIEEFDLEVTQPGSQVSLFQKQQDAAPTLTRPLPLTFNAEGIDRKFSRIYLFNYLETNGEPVGQWSSLEVEGTTTTVKGHMLRPGPNVLIFVSSNKTLPEAPEKASFLPMQPFDQQSLTDVDLKQVRLDRRVYTFYNRLHFKHKEFAVDVVKRSAGNEMDLPGTSEFLRKLKDHWDAGTVYFNKGGLGDFAYGGVALWINKEPVTETP